MTNCLATYIHDLSPFLLQIKGNFGVRWYGFMYVLGFLGAYFLLRWFSRIGCCELREEKVGDFVTIIALVGIMFSGRLGFMLMYNFDVFVRNPLSFFDFLGGGMASHGAILGTTLVVFLYARWQKVSWIGLGDNLVITGALGVFFGRIGNFINGELYGRGPTEHPWAMKFPAEIRDRTLDELVGFAERAATIVPGFAEQAQRIAETSRSAYDVADLFIATARKNEAFETFLGQELLIPRHPSQIYQSLCEGLLVFVILIAIRLKWRNAYHGILSGTFFILYAIARIAIENLREPDSSLILGITKGQFYSIFMILIGAGFLTYAFTVKRQSQAMPQATESGSNGA